jgi:hypothetical protein
MFDRCGAPEAFKHGVGPVSCGDADVAGSAARINAAKIARSAQSSHGPGFPSQHRDLVAQHQQFSVLGRGGAGEQHQPADHPGEDQIEQPQRPGSRSSSSHRVAHRRRPGARTGFWHPTRGPVGTARLGGDAPVDGVWPSDHFAVIADLSE